MGKLLTRHDYMDRLDVNFSRHLVSLTEKRADPRKEVRVVLNILQ